LVISDTGNQRIRYVVPDSINLTNDSGQTAFYLPWASALTNLTIANNPNLTNVNVGSLTSVSGELSITSNTSATVIDVSSLTTVSGGLDISGTSQRANSISVHSRNAGGAINVAANTAAGSLDLSSPHFRR